MQMNAEIRASIAECLMTIFTIKASRMTFQHLYSKLMIFIPVFNQMPSKFLQPFPLRRNRNYFR